MVDNYFMDIMGRGREAFKRGYQDVENIRRDVGEQQAARALSKGDTRAAKEAYGRAGMAEQVDVLAQREAAQAEAVRKREEEAKRQQQADQIAAEDRAARQQEAQFKSAVDKIDLLGNVAQWLKNIQPELRPEALGTLKETFIAMGIGPEVIARVQSSSLDDKTLDNFTFDMNQKRDELRSQANVSQYGATIYNPNTGQVTYTPAAGAPAPAATAGLGKPPSGFRWTAEGELEAIPGGPADRGTESETGLSATAGKEAMNLRKEFNQRPEVKDYRSKASTVSNMTAFASSPSPASDMSMIFAYMKMLDPTSVVREGEYANAQNATGIPDRIRNQYNKAISGTGLNPAQRTDFLKQAQSILRNAETTYRGVQNEYGDYARMQGIPVTMIFQGAPAATPPAPSRQGAFVLRPGAPGAPPPSPQARATGSRANPPPYATAEERELWSDMTPEEQAAVWAGE